MRDHRRDVDLSALPPDKAEVVRAFAATLQQVCEEETEKLLLSLYGFELFCDGIAALRVEQMSPIPRSGVKSRSEPARSRNIGEDLDRDGYAPMSALGGSGRAASKEEVRV